MNDKTQKITQTRPKAVISDRAAAVYAGLPNIEDEPARPAFDDHEGWARVQREKDQQMAALGSSVLPRLGVSTEKCTLAGVPCYRLTPPAVTHVDRVVFHIHGGAFTLFSLDVAVLSAALLAHHLSCEVVTVGYTLAPQAKAPQIRGEVTTAVQALRETLKTDQKLIGVGDSAGGALAAAAALSLRDHGKPSFDALILLSPWADLGEVGETYHTLKHVEPTYIYQQHLYSSAKAYCPDERQWADPLISPVYGDFTKGFPPTLIQGGTREIFLSNCVRLYQAIRQSGGDAELDIYEGMIHVFQILLGAFDAPEADDAFKAMNRFLGARL